jgi:O-antigen/teichoic acid export membrane protein
MITQRLLAFLIAVAAILPLLALAILLWRRFYREDAANTARRVAKNSAIPIAIRLVVRAMDMAFALVLYRFLSSDAVGQYDLAALLIVQYLGTFADFGLTTLLTREVSRAPDAAAQYFGTTLLLRGALTLLSLPLALAFVSAYGLTAARVPGASALTDEGVAAIFILCLTLFPAAYNNTVTAMFTAREQLEIPAAVELVSQVISIFARVAALVAGWGVLGLAWAAVGTTLATTVVFAILQARLLSTPRLRWDRRFALGLLRPAFPLMLNSLLINAAFSFDAFILRLFRDDLTVAQYRMPYRVISIALILPPLLTNAVFPLLSRYAEHDRQALKRTYNLTLHVLLLLAFPIAVGVTVTATLLVSLIVGQQEAATFLGQSDRALAILIWFLPLSYLNGLTQYVLIGLNRQSWITRSFAVMAAFNCICNLLLIPSFGIFAASVLTVLSEIVLFVMFLPVLRAEDVMPPLTRLIWRPALAALVMGLVMALVYPISPWLSIAAALPVYALLLWLLGTWGPEEQVLMRRVLGRS